MRETYFRPIFARFWRGKIKGRHLINQFQVRIQSGGQGVRTPPGKSQVIWVTIGNKQLDPPPPWKMLDPSGTLKNDIFYLN